MDDERADKANGILDRALYSSNMDKVNRTGPQVIELMKGLTGGEAVLVISGLLRSYAKSPQIPQEEKEAFVDAVMIDAKIQLAMENVITIDGVDIPSDILGGSGELN